MKFPCAKRISPVPYSTLRIDCAKCVKGRLKLAAPANLAQHQPEDQRHHNAHRAAGEREAADALKGC
jgi:hypothetical protein